MAQTFDTGAARAQRTLIRNAVITRLAWKHRSVGGYLTAIKALPGFIEGRGDEAGLAALANSLLGKAPALAVALGRKTYEAADLEAFTQRGELELRVYALSEHSKDLVVGRLAADAISDADDTADPGIETILEHVEEALLGQELGIDGTSELRATDEDELATFDNLSIWVQTYRLQVERRINPNRGATTLITSIEGDHFLDGIPDPGTLSPLVETIAELDPEA